MSHYTVGVIVPKEVKEGNLRYYVDELLEPFDENMEVQPYIAVTIEELKERYEEYKSRCEKVEPFEEFIIDYCGAGNDEEGNALSTYNPDSKWDSYSIGGRWNNSIKTKDNREVNYARIKDIQFKEVLSDEEISNLKEVYTKKIKEGDFYKAEYYQERYPSFEDYLEENQHFSTYAILTPDGEWLEPGQMGWFGMSSATPEESKSFQSKYMEKINSQNENDWFVIVDCHI